jgi:hypothetical protein
VEPSQGRFEAASRLVVPGGPQGSAPPRSRRRPAPAYKRGRADCRHQQVVLVFFFTWRRPGKKAPGKRWPSCRQSE